MNIYKATFTQKDNQRKVERLIPAWDTEQAVTKAKKFSMMHENITLVIEENYIKVLEDGELLVI